MSGTKEVLFENDLDMDQFLLDFRASTSRASFLAGILVPRLSTTGAGGVVQAQELADFMSWALELTYNLGVHAQTEG